jgi:hypothetical protein
VTKLVYIKDFKVGHLYKCTEAWPLFESVHSTTHTTNIIKDEIILCVEEPLLYNGVVSSCKVLFKDIVGIVCYRGTYNDSQYANTFIQWEDIT